MRFGKFGSVLVDRQEARLLERPTRFLTRRCLQSTNNAVWPFEKPGFWAAAKQSANVGATFVAPTFRLRLRSSNCAVETCGCGPGRIRFTTTYSERQPSMADFEASVTLNCSVEDIFDFLLQPENMKRISPPELDLVFVNAPKMLELGSLFQFKLQSFGLVQEIAHEITALSRPDSFIEKQVKGPLKHWVHEHILKVDESGVVTVIDRIEFEPPGGLAGLLVTKSRILDALNDGFEHRHEQLKKLLEEEQ